MQSVYEGKLATKSVILGVMNFNFIGGSMGSVVGELVSRALIMAGEKNKPFILVALQEELGCKKELFL